MKDFDFETDWDHVKHQLRERYQHLTDEDLTYALGKGEEMLHRLRVKLSLSEDALRSQLEEMRATAQPAIDRARHRIHEIAGDVRHRAADAAEHVRAKAHAAADEARARADVAYGQVRERARTVQHDGEEYVRSHPREALLGALCAGFVAGLLIRH